MVPVVTSGGGGAAAGGRGGCSGRGGWCWRMVLLLWYACGSRTIISVLQSSKAASNMQAASHQQPRPPPKPPSCLQVKANTGALQQLHITSRVGLINKVLALYYSPNHPLNKCVQMHAEVLKAGVALSSVMNKLPNSQTDKHAMKEMGAEKTRTLLLSVLSRYNALDKAVKVIRDQGAPTSPAPEASEAEATAAADLKTLQASMWDVDSHNFLVPLLSDENLMDCIATACMHYKEKLQTFRMKLEKGLGSAMGDKNWKHHFQGRFSMNEVPLEEILEKASETIMVVPLKGKDLQTSLADFSQEHEMPQTVDFVGCCGCINLMSLASATGGY